MCRLQHASHFVLWSVLTHRSRKTHIYEIKLGHHWFIWCFVTCLTPNPYLKQCWPVANRTIKNKFQWYFNQNTAIFIQENLYENIVCKLAAILFRPQCVNSKWHSDVLWRHRSRSTLVQIMACCMTAPSHYMNQCSLLTDEVLWHSSGAIL